MSRTKNVASGIAMGLMYNVLSVLLPFVCKTIIIRKLGTEYIGLGSLFTSILQVLSLSELGFGTAISYLLYKPIAEKDVKKVNEILAFYRKIYRIVGAVIILVSVILVPFLKYLVKGDVPADVNLYILYGIYVFHTVISYLMFAYKKVLFTGNQDYGTEMKIASSILIFQYVLQIISLIIFEDYYLYIIILPIGTVLGNIISLIVINKKYPEYHAEGSIDKGELKGVFKNTAGAFCYKIGTTIYLSVDSIVISAFLGLTILGIYNNYYYIIASLIAVFSVIHNSLRPTIGNIIATDSHEKVWNSFGLINFAYMWLTIVCCACCLCLFQDFEWTWAGEENMFGMNIVIALVIYLFTGRATCVMGIYQEAAGILWTGKYIPIIASVVNLTVNIILVQHIGLMGVIISSIVSAVLINFPGYLYVIFGHLFIDKNKLFHFIAKYIIYSVEAVLACVACYFVFLKVPGLGWGRLVIKGCLVFITANIIMLILNCWNKDLRTIIYYGKNKIRGRLKK